MARSRCPSGTSRDRPGPAHDHLTGSCLANLPPSWRHRHHLAATAAAVPPHGETGTGMPSSNSFLLGVTEKSSTQHWPGLVPRPSPKCPEKVKILSGNWGNRSCKGKCGGIQRVVLCLGARPSPLTRCNVACQRAGSLLDSAFKKCFAWKSSGKFSSPVQHCFIFFFFPVYYFYMKQFWHSPSEKMLNAFRKIFVLMEFMM